MNPPVLLHLGEATHGVDRYARTVAEATSAIEPGVQVRLLDLTDLDDEAPHTPERVHVHVTDRLWGNDPVQAAARFAMLARRCEVGVTLHDVPQLSDGPSRLPRRVAAYRAVVERAALVVCNSEHERLLLAQALGYDVDAHVIPLPVVPPRPPPASWRGDGVVAVLGYFYPGKGHGEVVEAVATLGATSDVVALGRASAGHEGELESLVAEAATRGVRLSATGFLSDADLARRSRSSSVPVIAHQHVSASGSLTDWITAGRRPIVVDSRYFREMAELRPGTMTLVALADLPAAIDHALTHPASTWLAPGVGSRPDLVDTARAYLAAWARW